MKTEEPYSDAEATRTFETELSQLILESFARGAAIEKTWEITIPVTDAPDWEVRIEKRNTGGDPSYEPGLLEE